MSSWSQGEIPHSYSQCFEHEVQTFQSMPLDPTIESLDGEFSEDIKVKTCPKRVTGNKVSIDSHLKECDSAEPARKALWIC